MGRVIAGLYEIEQQIGSGGGGVVYLGRHLRLNKLVVLKADKRSLQTRPEALRREVDMLKGLSHTYIPQVYDFVEEGGVVYTVMDYIDGESLDRILKRGQTPPQPQLIQWACQILEALCYLHSRPPHGILHADIKPSNIMLRPNGDICLIDYNIALALGESGAVKVGYSIGYASPEHYGIGAVNTGESSSGNQGTGSAVSENGNVRQPVMLDVRSDIYSLGATLYHLISGRRPPQDTSLAEPLGREICSPAVAKIIQKAMAREPDRRYQTAEEMLAAFRQLHKSDPRTLRHKRRMRLCAGMLTALFLAGGFMTFAGLKQMEQKQAALALAEYSASELEQGNVSKAVELALQAIPEGKGILDAPVTANAQKALTAALQVYDLADCFQSLDIVSLPSSPFGIAVSPDGKRFAAVCQAGVEIYDTESRELLAELPIIESALAEAEFVDNERLLFAGNHGVTLYDIGRREILWTGGEASTLAVSGDGTVAAAVNRDEERAILYHMEDGSVLAELSFDGKHMETAFNDIFANPDNRIFSLNENGSMLAVSFSDGALIVFDVENPDGDLIIYEESDYTRFEGGFFQELFAFTAGKEDQSLFGLVDCTEGVYVGELESRNKMRAQTDKDGILLSEGNLLVRIEPESLAETEIAFTDALNIEEYSVDGGYALVVTDDSGFSFYDRGANLISHEKAEEDLDFAVLAGGYAVFASRNRPQIWLMKLMDHEDAGVLAYDAGFYHDEARISQDGKTAMLFDYKGYQIYNLSDGKMVSEGKFPDAEKIYDQQFQKKENGSCLEVTWYDGTVREYSAADGSLLAERTDAPPDDTLYEEFSTERYRVTSSLHGAPEVYEQKTGRKLGTLESEAYLTYVTQIGDYLVTEYVNADGERYGLLLNEKLETAAELPGLCDISGDMLVFDYKSGNLRQCRLYSLQELAALGEAYMETNRRERKE